MTRKLDINPLSGKLDLIDETAQITNPLIFKGDIDSSDDFPTSAEVQIGWFYTISANVTDNDPTKTNTGQSFLSGDEIAWNGTNWTTLGNRLTDHSALSNLDYASAGHTGFEPTVTKGDLTAGSTKISIGGTGTNAVIGSGVSVDVDESNLSLNNLGEKNHSNLDQLTWSTAGHTIDTDLDMNSNSITEIETTQFDTSYTVTGSEPIGTTYWDADNHTISTVLEWGAKLQHGFELYTFGTDEGNDFPEGSAVSVKGSTGNKVAFELTDVSDQDSVDNYIGLLTTPVDSGNRIATREGSVRGIDTTGGVENWQEGDWVYVSTTPGGLTNIKPEAPSACIRVGTVTNVHANQGIIELDRWIGTKFVDLCDVNGTPLNTTGQIAVWDNDNSYFDFNYNITDYATTSSLSDYAKLDGTNQPFTGDIKVGDNIKHYFGDDDDASIYYDGTNLVVNPAEVGSGGVNLLNSGLTLKNTEDTSRNVILTTNPFLANFGIMSVYGGASGNVGTSISVYPRGTGFSSTIKSQIAVNNLDSVANPSNFEGLVLRATGTKYGFFESYGGTGTIRPITFSTYNNGSTDQIYLDTNLNVKLPNDNQKLYFGAGDDASIYYDGTDLVINSQEVGSGDLVIPNGNVGIGTSSPSSKLHVVSTGNNFIRSEGTTNAGFQIYKGATFAGSYVANDITNTVSFYGYNDAANPKLQIDTSGNIKIPADSKKLYFGAGDDASITYDGTNLVIDSQEVGSGDLVIPNGNVGIGTTPTLNCTLHIKKIGAQSRAVVEGDYGIFQMIARGSVANLVSLNLRPKAASQGYIKFTHERVADRWSIGIEPSTNDRLYFKAGGESGIIRLILNNNGDLYLNGDNKKLSWGTSGDASIYYDGTNMIINPKVVGSGYLNIQGQTLLDDKLMFAQTDGNEYIDSLTDGYLDYGATTAHRFNNNVEITGGNIRSIATKTSDYTILTTDYTLLLDASSNTITATLPASPTEGQIYNIKCIDSTFTCTVARNGNNIDGDASDLTLIEDESVTLQSDGTNWWII